jgi:hypothetical protein
MVESFLGTYNGRIAIVESHPEILRLKRFHGDEQSYAWLDWGFNRKGRLDNINVLLPERGVCILENIDEQEGEWDCAKFLYGEIPEALLRLTSAYSGSGNRLKRVAKSGHSQAYQLVDVLRRGEVEPLDSEEGFRPLTELVDDGALELASSLVASLEFQDDQGMVTIRYREKRNSK